MRGPDLPYVCHETFRREGSVDLCPYLDDHAKSVLGATTRPPIRLVKIGVGERSFAVGEEFVLYRHEKTFYHAPGILFRVTDVQSPEEITEITRRVRDESFVRVGSDLRFNGIAVEQVSGSTESFAKAVETIEKVADLPLVLMSGDPAALPGSTGPLRHLPPADPCGNTGELFGNVRPRKTARVPACSPGPAVLRGLSDW